MPMAWSRLDEALTVDSATDDEAKRIISARIVELRLLATFFQFVANISPFRHLFCANPPVRQNDAVRENRVDLLHQVCEN